MAGPVSIVMQRQQRSLYSKIESEIRKENNNADESSKVDNYVTCVQITSLNSRHRPSQLVILLAGAFGDLVTFDDEGNSWTITTRQYRSTALRNKVQELNPKIRRRWTAIPYTLPHAVVHDVPVTTSIYPAFTGIAHMQVKPETDGGDIVYSLSDSDYKVTVRIVNNCGSHSMEVERQPGQQLDTVQLEKLGQDDFSESERMEQAMAEVCCCVIL